jgi:hypothetical protein
VERVLQFLGQLVSAGLRRVASNAGKGQLSYVVVPSSLTPSEGVGRKGVSLHLIYSMADSRHRTKFPTLTPRELVLPLPTAYCNSTRPTDKSRLATLGRYPTKCRMVAQMKLKTSSKNRELVLPSQIHAKDTGASEVRLS